MSPEIALAALPFGAVGLTFAANHKLPASFYEGEGFLARMLRCSFCTGTQIGFWLLLAWVVLLGTPSLAWGFFHLMAAPAIGVAAMVTQRLLNLVSAIESLAERAE